MGEPDALAAREKVVLDDISAAATVFGQHGEHLKVVQRELGVRAHVRGNEVTLLGDEHDVALGRNLLEQLYAMARRGQPLGADDLARAVQVLRQNGNAELRDVFSDTVLMSARARRIAPKSLAQKRYVEAIRQADMVFGIGPAGTGKTYLAMAMAVRALLDKQVKRIVLARPAVEAGEKLGFLPGSMVEKVNPYLRPLYDALQDMMDLDRSQQLIERGVIEVAPLAFMRGRTLNDSFVILDEAQNSTSEQMKMFLTRLGYESKAVITGDVTQIDLPAGQRSGLMEARALLSHIEGIRFCYFTEVDVVRHPLVSEIIKAYDLAAQARFASEERGGRASEARNGRAADARDGRAADARDGRAADVRDGRAADVRDGRAADARDGRASEPRDGEGAAPGAGPGPASGGSAPPRA